MGRPRRRALGGGGLGMCSIRRISWTRTVSWVIMEAPPGVSCLDTRHPRRLFASGQASTRFLLIYDQPSVRHASPMPCLEALGDKILDAQPERLGRRVAENLRRGPVPEDDPAGGRVRDDYRVPDPLEEAAYSQVLGT